MSDHTILDIVQNASQSTKEQLAYSPYGRQLLALSEINMDLDDALFCLQIPATASIGEMLKLFNRPPPSELMDSYKNLSPKRIGAASRKIGGLKK